mgnify:CR=1 FL=1
MKIKLVNKIFEKIKELTAHKKIDSINCEVSRNCNLSCIQCANHSIYTEPPRGKFLLTPEIFSKLTPILPSVRVINFDNHGEPLLNPGLEEFIRIAKSVAPKIKTSFTTNFQFMSFERSTKLLESGLDIIQVSISGISEETYKKIMINGDFSKFVKNLEDFRLVLEDTKNKLFEFSACVTAMRSNINELPLIPEFIRKYGVTRLRINSVLPFSLEMLKESLLEKDEFIRHSKSIYEETIRNAKKLGITATCVLTPDVSTFEADSICNYPIKNFSVSYNGDVCPCWMLDIPNGYNCYVRGKTYKIPYVKFGNINDENIFNILNRSGFFTSGEQLIRGNLPEFCSNCPVGKHLTCG